MPRVALLLPVVAAGISIVRTDISWAGIETTRGRYNFTGTDPYIAALKGARQGATDRGFRGLT